MLNNIHGRDLIYGVRALPLEWGYWKFGRGTQEGGVGQEQEMRTIL